VRHSKAAVATPPRVTPLSEGPQSTYDYTAIPDGHYDRVLRVETRFDCITLIEVIEHLTAEEIRVLFGHIARLLKPGGKLIVTTPNYASTWPLLEQLLNRFGDVNYEEQHITRLNYFNFERRLAEVYPRLREEFAVELKTTTHLLTPFLAGLSFRLARALSRLVPSTHWRVPFGNLVLVSLTRKP
jgi:SAM-dependent methyltransferase